MTGLRNPCAQLDRFRPGLMAAVLDRDEKGGLVRKAGVMGRRAVRRRGTPRRRDPGWAAVGGLAVQVNFAFSCSPS